VSNGEVLLRLGPDVERLRKAAEAEGISMSQFLREGMEMRMAAGQPGSAAITAALRLVERAARQLVDDPLGALAARDDKAPAERKQDHWERLMSDG
jgi:hypothetical protein